MTQQLLNATPLRVLVADDELFARARLRQLLAQCPEPATEVVAEAAHGAQVLAWLQDHPCDLLLLDVHMPGMDGLQLARALRELPRSPWVVFVTAHAAHALQAFELDAIDYLTKPVRVERLQAALQRVAQRQREREALTQTAGQTAEPVDDSDVLTITERGRLVRVPLAQVLYFKAELKYLTVRTADARYTLDGSLGDWEQRLAGRFLRVHRNALVAKSAVRELGKHADDEPSDSEPIPLEASGGDNWAVRVAPVNEWLVVSRRQLAAVREALRANATKG